MNQLVKFGAAEAIYTKSGSLSAVRIDVWHTGLNEHRLLRAPDKGILENKLQALLDSWEQKWSRISAKQSAESARFAGKSLAESRSQEAQDALAAADGLLTATLAVNDAVDWGALEDRAPYAGLDANAYPGIEFGKKGKPQRITPVELPPAPDPNAAKYQPQLGLLDKIFASRKAVKVAEAGRIYAADHDRWLKAKREVEQREAAANERLKAAQAAYAQGQLEHQTRQDESNARVRELEQMYRARHADAVVANAELILNASNYPDWLRKDYTVQYNPETRVLLVDFQLPAKEDLPSLSKVSFVAARNELKESYLSEADSNRLFDSVLYQVALRTLHELFEGDTANTIDAIVFNGWVTAVNKSTGRDETGCILSVQAVRDEFLRIDLSRVDPKACFKQLKGVAAAKLSGLTPVAPILQLEKDDPRFVASHEVAGRLEEGTNLAAIDWEEFEHLVRELFEREFAAGGGEVKVTRASADGGVDAVIFDPDPIRGGKIVVQAKRYTNTVGVAAVRDLYGTMMNEGAMKGLLVTTSDYGPDAYAFAKDKPITLLNGSNLLHLLGKHGHKARIDLAEAKRLREAATRPS